MLAYPLVAVGINIDVATFQRRDVDESESGEAAEHECVAYCFQSRKLMQVNIHHRLQFRLCQKFSFRYCTLEAFAHEGIFRDPFVCHCILHHIFQVTQVADCGVVGRLLCHSQEVLEVLNEASADFFDRDVLGVLGESHELLQIGDTAFPSSEGGSADIAALKLFLALLVHFAKHIAKHLRFLHCAKIVVTEDFRIHKLVLAKKHIVDFIETGADILKVLVEFKFLFSATRCNISLLIP